MEKRSETASLPQESFDLTFDLIRLEASRREQPLARDRKWRSTGEVIWILDKTKDSLYPLQTSAVWKKCIVSINCFHSQVIVFCFFFLVKDILLISSMTVNYPCHNSLFMKLIIILRLISEKIGLAFGLNQVSDRGLLFYCFGMWLYLSSLLRWTYSHPFM